MKVVRVELSGSPTPGDTVMIHGSHPIRGGRTTAGWVVKEGNTLEDIVSGLVWSSGNNNFLGEFEFKPKGNTITIVCSNLVAETVFAGEVRGSSVQIAVEEL